MTTGNDLVAETLRRLGVEDFFFLMGGPLNEVEKGCLDAGIRGIDVRHEMAASLAAHAYSRISGRVGVCMGCSGPGFTNLVTGVAAAWADRAPVLVIAGSSGIGSAGKQAFQEIDQLAIMRPITKWATRVYDPARIPEILSEAWYRCQAGAPGPVYVDLPGDLIYEEVEHPPAIPQLRLPASAAPDADSLAEVHRALSAAERPVVVAGSGVVWDQAWGDLESFLDVTGLPLYTTPMARGIVSEDHPSIYQGARSLAFREADCVLFLGTRMNYVVGFGQPPRFAPDATVIRVDIDSDELGRRQRAIPVHSGCSAFLREAAKLFHGHDPSRWGDWIKRLSQRHEAKAAEFEQLGRSGPGIHPVDLCRAIEAELADDDILILDGQETLNFGRQSIPIRRPRSHLNSGVLGAMGVGVPYALGAKAAAPGRRVVVLTGDGAFGMSAIELNTAVRHELDIHVVISNNGGWTADPDGVKPGRDLPNIRYDKLAESMECRAAHVDRLQDVAEAVRSCLGAPGPTVLEVATDSSAKSTTTKFSSYQT